MSLLIENGWVYGLGEQGWVLIDDNRITDVGRGQAPFGTERIDASGKAVLPGFINAHTHLLQTFCRGLGDDKTLLEWLEAYIWPVAEHYRAGEAAAAARLGMVENLRSGVTSVIDHHYVHTDGGIDAAVCRAAEDTGIRLLLARGWADANYRPELAESGDEIVDRTMQLHAKWHGAAGGRIRVEHGPLIPWGCSDETMRRTLALARETGFGTHIHIAETKTEVEMSLEACGMGHIEWLLQFDALGPDVQLVHSVWLDEHELDLIAEHGGVVVHCPVSNMYLASGVAPIVEMRERQIPIALGTDGPGSNNAQDMLEVLKTTALLQKVHRLDAMALLPHDVLDMAFAGGAAAMGLGHELGALRPGFVADITLINLQTPFAAPVHRPESALVYNSSVRDVDTVIVDGNPVLRGGELCDIDEAEILANADDACRDLIARAGIHASSH